MVSVLQYFLRQILLAVSHDIPLKSETLTLIAAKESPRAAESSTKKMATGGQTNAIYIPKNKAQHDVEGREDGIHKIFDIMKENPYETVLEVGLDILLALTQRRKYWKSILANTPCVSTTLMAMAQCPESRPIQFRACHFISELSGDLHMRRQLVEAGAVEYILKAFEENNGDDSSLQQMCLFCLASLTMGKPCFCSLSLRVSSVASQTFRLLSISNHGLSPRRHYRKEFAIYLGWVEDFERISVSPSYLENPIRSAYNAHRASNLVSKTPTLGSSWLLVQPQTMALARVIRISQRIQ
jgi:hypothetical protein